MNGGPQALEIFGLTLSVEKLEDGIRMRTMYKQTAVRGGFTIWPTQAQLEELLAQIERQYHDFSEPIDWTLEVAEKRLSLAWTLDALGHVHEGRLRMSDGAAGWALEGRLSGDQSYLPRIAMGLQLILRS